MDELGKMSHPNGNHSLECNTLAKLQFEGEWL